MTCKEVIQMLRKSGLKPEVRFDEDNNSGYIYFGIGFSLNGDAKKNLMKSLADGSSLLNYYIDMLNGRSQYSSYVCGYLQGYKDKANRKQNEFENIVKELK